MVKIRPNHLNTYLEYYRILSVELAKLRQDLAQLDPETGSPDELATSRATLDFLLRERNEVAVGLCDCLMDHDGVICPLLTPKSRARCPARARFMP